jgi:hypothetical protein
LANTGAGAESPPEAEAAVASFAEFAISLRNTRGQAFAEDAELIGLALSADQASPRRLANASG